MRLQYEIRNENRASIKSALAGQRLTLMLSVLQLERKNIQLVSYKWFVSLKHSHSHTHFEFSPSVLNPTAAFSLI